MPHPQATDGLETFEASFEVKINIKRLAHGHVQEHDFSPRRARSRRRPSKAKQTIRIVAVGTWCGFVLTEEAALLFHLGPAAVILALGGVIATPAAWVAVCALQSKRSEGRGSN